MSERKLLARVFGHDESISVTASSVVVSEDTIIRDLNLQLGRIFSNIKLVEFLTLDNTNKEVKLASATATDDHWLITYTDKKIKSEKVERTTTRKTGDNWKDLPIAKARNLGPDMMILTGAVAKALEFKATVVKSETKVLKSKLAEQEAEITRLKEALAQLQTK